MVKSGWAMPGIDFRTKQSGKSWQAFGERKNAFNSFNRSVDKKNLAEEVQTTRPILNIYFWRIHIFTSTFGQSC